VLIVVVRYFGGVKLGVGGLINAYRTAAKLALEESTIVTRTINIDFKVLFAYKNMNKVMRIIKEKNLNIVSQKMELSCEMVISVRKKEVKSVKNSFEALFDIEFVKLLN
jgi:putative IMPACT (imprinted ancient) family translation regulator